MEITGIIKLTRNSTWGYTARVISLSTKGDNYGKFSIHSGCNYDKVEHAINSALRQIGVSTPDCLRIKKMFSTESSDFYREHFFEVDDDLRVTIY